jgi:hypothetical protein
MIRVGQLAAILASLVLVISSACDRSTRPPTRPPWSAGHKIVNDYVKATGVAFKPCDDFACLEQAVASGCHPARLHIARHTIEGQPAFDDCFVRRSKRDDACQVVVISDHSLNYWARCRVLNQTCTSIDDARRVVVQAELPPCGATEILYEPKSCHPPLLLRIEEFLRGRW